jgi:hypothetical protein
MAGSNKGVSASVNFLKMEKVRACTVLHSEGISDDPRTSVKKALRPPKLPNEEIHDDGQRTIHPLVVTHREQGSGLTFLNIAVKYSFREESRSSAETPGSAVRRQ